MRFRADWWARAIGLCLGLAVALVAVTGWSVPRGDGSLGTDLVFSTAPTGELAVTPMGPFLSVTAMRPGSAADAVSGDLEVFNQTGVTLDIGIRGLPSNADLDRMLMVEIRADGVQLFLGPLGELRSWTETSFHLASGGTATVTIRTWMPRDVGPGWEGRMVTVPFEFRSVPAE